MNIRNKKKAKEMIKDTVDRSDELDKKLDSMPNSLDKTVSDLVLSGRRIRRLVNWVIISVVFELLLTLGLATIYTQQQIQNNNIQQNHIALVATCEAGNKFRSDNLTLWKYILALPRDPALPAETPQQAQVRADFEKYVNGVFAPRDCKHLDDAQLKTAQ